MATKISKQHIIGLKELRLNMERYIKRVDNGETITVFRRSTPLFKLAPVDRDEEASWETVIDFTKETGQGISGKALLTKMKNMHGQD